MINIKVILKKVLPRPLCFALLTFRDSIRRLSNTRKYCGGEYYCPICDSRISTFLFNVIGLASCPICDSSERHRVDWVFFQKKTNLFDGTPKKMLHIAPELFFISQFRKIKELDYISTDLEDPRAMKKMDITNIEFPDHRFDIIYCSHVLEHIIDDRKAISELYRVCKPGGWAVLQVPIETEKTFEDFSITAPEKRKEVFGQENHVRNCGLDYWERMRDGGFIVTVCSPHEIMTPSDFDRMGITVRDCRQVFYCTKPS